MRWTVHGERSLYDSEWVRLDLVDVEPRAGTASSTMWCGCRHPPPVSS